jgi:hypothetical protein
MVEHQLPKMRVVGSIPIYRSQLFAFNFIENARYNLLKQVATGIFIVRWKFFE